jgi:hypothetical protein
MKNNQFAQMLLFVLLLSALFSAWLSLHYTTSLRKVRQLAPAMAQVNAASSLFQALYNDAQEYAKKNPDLVPVVRAVGMAHLTNAPLPGAKPAAK